MNESMLPYSEPDKWVLLYAADVIDTGRHTYTNYAQNFFKDIPKGTDQQLLRAFFCAYINQTLAYGGHEFRKVKAAYFPCLMDAFADVMKGVGNCKYGHDWLIIFLELLFGFHTLLPDEKIVQSREDFQEYSGILSAASRYWSIRGIIAKAEKLSALFSPKVTERVATAFDHLNLFENYEANKPTLVTSLMLLILLSSKEERHQHLIEKYILPDTKIECKRSRVYQLSGIADALPGNTFAVKVAMQLRCDYPLDWINEYETAVPDSERRRSEAEA